MTEEIKALIEKHTSYTVCCRCEGIGNYDGYTFCDDCMGTGLVFKPEELQIITENLIQKVTDVVANKEDKFE